MGLNYWNQREMEQVQPRGYAEYMSNYGEHFSKRLCEWAVSKMQREEKQPDGAAKKKKLEPWTKEQVDDMLKRYGVAIENDKGYDKVYVANMCKADFFEDSVPDESHVARYVKNLLDDPDGYEGMVFNRFLMDCLGKHEPIDWEDMV